MEASRTDGPKAPAAEGGSILGEPPPKKSEGPRSAEALYVDLGSFRRDPVDPLDLKLV